MDTLCWVLCEALKTTCVVFFTVESDEEGCEGRVEFLLWIPLH